MKCEVCKTTKSLRWKMGLCNSCYTKQWRINNSDKVKKYSELIKIRFYHSKRKAKSRKIKWNLSLEEFESFCNKPCYYCANKIGKIVTQSSGLDRLNNEIGYQIDNVVSCCNSCNMIKNEVLTSDEMKNVAKYIISLRSTESTAKGGDSV